MEEERNEMMPPERVAASNERKEKKGGCLRRLLLGGFVFLLVAGTGVYFARGWLAKKAEAMLDDELTREGIFVDYGSVSYRSWRGLILKDVIFFKTAEQKERVLEVSDAACKFSPLDLVLGKPFSGKVTVENGTIAFLSGARSVLFADIDAALQLKEDRLEIEQLTAKASGIIVRVTGDIIIDPGGEEGKPGASIFPDFAPIIEAVEQIGMVPRADPPLLVLDLHSVEDRSVFPLEIDASLKGRDFDWQGARFGELDMTAKVKPAASGSAAPCNITLVAKGRRTDWEGLALGRFGVRASAVAAPEGARFPFKVAANTDADRIEWDKLSVGKSDADVLVEPSAAETKSGFTAKVVSRSSAFTWEKATFDGVDLTVRYRDEDDVAIDSLVAAGFGGKIEGKGLLQPQSNRLSIESLVSSVDLIALVSGLDRELGKSLADFRTTKAPNLSAAGFVVDLNDPLASRGRVKTVEAGALSMAIDKAKLEVSDVVFSAALEGGTLQFPDLQMRLLGGEGKVAVKIPLKGDPLSFEIAAAVDKVKMAELGHFTGLENADSLKGFFAADYAGRGAGEIAGFTGGGMVRITEARLYQSRVFGPLWQAIRNSFTNLRGEQNHEVSCNYRMNEGVFSTADLTLESSRLIVSAEGTFDIPKEYVSMDVRANLKGAVGVATAVASKVFEFHGEGHVDNVEFKRNMIVGGVVKGGADAIKNGADAVKNGAEAVKDRAGEAVGKAGEAVGEAGKKVRDAAEALRPRNILRRGGREPAAE